MIQAQCHCGNIKLQLPKLTDTMTCCNCSICARYAALWGYYLQAEVEISVGEYGSRQYCRGDREILFHCCNQCGCVTHYSAIDVSPTSGVAVNYRMLEPQLIKELAIRYFDGANSFKAVEKVQFTGLL